jgi:hypothetical protein
MDEVSTAQEFAARTVCADLRSARFRAGVARRHWRLLEQTIPILIVAVSAVEPDNSATEYAFRFELKGFPGIAPDVRIWDVQKNAPLATDLRPKGALLVIEAFNAYSSDRERAFRLIVNGHVICAAGVGVLR